ncbi:MAG: addiction module protein [Kiritimatiellia bacterium]
MEGLWEAMTAVAEPEPPAWHGDILAERRRRAASGEKGFMSVSESKRRLYEEVHAR